MVELSGKDINQYSEAVLTYCRNNLGLRVTEALNQLAHLS